MQNQNNLSLSQSSNKNRFASDGSSEIDEVMSKVNGYFKSAKGYVVENPKETAAIVVAVAIAGWALFYTKPGRSLFDKGASVFIPQVSKWITENLGSTVASATKH